MPRIKYSALAFMALLILTFVGLSSQPAMATNFQAGNIMTDEVMGNYNSMSEAAIHNFLLSQCNRSTCLVHQNINGESAAHIIYRAAQDYHINPQVIIVLLQKEQSLITSNATATRLRKATGYGCPDTAACDSKYYGFKNQVRNASNLFRTVLNGGWSNYPVGWRYIKYHPSSSCGGSSVYIANRATSALYRYTPYQPNGALLSGGRDSCSSYGNYNFFNYFNKWFGSTGVVNTISARQVIPEMHSVYLPSGTFAIKSISGKSLAFVSESNDSGAQAQIVNYHGGESQQFKFLKDGKYYKIRHVASGRYLDVSGAGTSDGTKVQLWDGNDTCAQKWAVEIRGSHYTLRSACSGKALDINNANIYSSGVHVQIWDDNSTIAQQWDFVNLSSAPIKDGEYNLQTSAGTVLSLEGEYLDNGTATQTGISTTSYTQLFQIKRRPDGYYDVKNTASGRMLDVSGADTANGTKIQLWDSNNTCAQRWVIKSREDGYQLHSSCSGKAMDVNNAEISSDGTKVQIWDDNNTIAQKWYFSNRPSPILSSGSYTISARLDNDYIVTPWQQNTPTNGTNTMLWYRRELKQPSSEVFNIFYDTRTGQYDIYNTYTGRFLDAAGAGRTSGTNIHFWSGNGTCAQHWTILPVDNDHYKILNACSRLALSHTNDRYLYGDNILLRPVSNDAKQVWKLTQR